MTKAPSAVSIVCISNNITMKRNGESGHVIYINSIDIAGVLSKFHTELFSLNTSCMLSSGHAHKHAVIIKQRQARRVGHFQLTVKDFVTGMCRSLSCKI